MKKQPNIIAKVKRKTLKTGGERFQNGFQILIILSYIFIP
jgi:hypothetical protein